MQIQRTSGTGAEAAAAASAGDTVGGMLPSLLHLDLPIFMCPTLIAFCPFLLNFVFPFSYPLVCNRLSLK